MKKALFVLFFVTFMVAGVVPMTTAVAQTPPPAPHAVTAEDAYAAAASTLAEMRRNVAELRAAIEAAGRRDSDAVKGLKARLAGIERGYTALKEAVAAGGDPAKLAKAHADALTLLKGSKEALAAYEHLHIGVAGDLSGTAAGFKCPLGTSPRQKVASATLVGRGSSNDVMFDCVALKGDVVVPEKRSETIGATGIADAARLKAAADAAEARRLPLGWRLARGVALTAAGAVATYFVVGALSKMENADHNGKVAAGMVGALGVGLTLFEF